jgi:hypothetical protein
MQSRYFFLIALLVCAVSFAVPATKNIQADEAPVSLDEVQDSPEPEPQPAKIVLKDMSDKHWAAPSVYNCIRLGITKGYPDGTFRGEKTVNRYELMVFLNNTAVRLEKMMDDKIEESMFANEDGAMSNKALEELKTEIELIKEQLGTTANGSINETSVTTRFSVDLYAGSRSVATHDIVQDEKKTFAEQTYQGIYTFTVTKNVDKYTGLEFVLGTTGKAKGWAIKKFNDYFSMNFDAVVGNGQVILADKHVLEGEDTSLGLGGTFLDVKTNFRFSVLGNTLVDADLHDLGVTAESVKVNKARLDAEYKIPLKIPYIGYWTLGSGVERYYTETNRGLNQQLSTTRYVGSSTFDIVKDVRLKTQYIKEIFSAPTLNNEAQLQNSLRQSLYYDANLMFGDVFKSGTEWSVYYAYKGSQFGRGKIKERIPGINPLGYAAGMYFENDWEGNNRMPSADITTEVGGSIRQEICKSQVYVNLGYVVGRAIPDSDLKDDDTKYKYTMEMIGLDWLINKYYTVYVKYEGKQLNDSSFDDDHSTQYSDRLGLFGMRFIF